MANIVSSPYGYTYDGKNSLDIIIKPVFLSPDLMNKFRIVPNVKSKVKLPLSGKTTKIVKAAGDCGDGFSSSGRIAISSEVLEVCDMEVNVDVCFADFRGAFLEEKYRMDMNYQPVEGDLLDFIEGELINGLKQDVPRIGMFGDTTLTSTDYNMCDGFWKRIIQKVPYDITKVTINPTLVANAGNSITDAQAFLGIFKQLVNGAGADLKGAVATDKLMYVTPAIYDALNDAYEVLRANNGYLEGLLNAGGSLTFRGIKIWTDYNHTHYIADDLANDKPYRILYYHKQALAIGTDVTDELMRVQLIPDIVGRKMIGRAYFKMGTQILFPDLVRVAY